MFVTRIMLAALLALTTLGCSPKAPIATATIAQFQFSPATLEVPLGATVVWTNRDDILHTVTSGTARSAGLGSYEAIPDGRFDGRLDGVGSEFRFTFDRAGTYAYFCDRHRHMTATVVVK